MDEETTNVGFEDFLPDDFLNEPADSTAGQTLENATDNADNSEPAEVPATDNGEKTEEEGAVSPDGETMESETPQTESSAEPEKHTFRYKHNHEDVEETLTEAEQIDRFQRLRAYEDKEKRKQFHGITERLAEEFPTASDQTIRMWARQEMSGYEPPAEDEQSAETRNEKDTEQKLMDENASLRVKLAAAEAAAKSALKEAAIHKQNADNIRRAPIKGTSGGGTKEQKPDPFLEGLMGK